MLGYIYDANTKEYLYSTAIQENPKHAGEYLMPDNCTLIEPTAAPAGKVNCFINDAWAKVTDHRGGYQVKLADVTFSKVDYIGEAHTGYQFITDEVYADYQSDNEKYKVVDGVFTDISDTQEYQDILARREAERVAKLSLTKREVFLALYADKGITPEQLEAQITSPEALIEFKYAEKYYRGNPLIDTVGQMLGYTPQQLDTLFKTGGF